MIRNLLPFFCFLLCASASGQNVLTLDTAPLGGAKTVILPTYDNLLKLRMADNTQLLNTMKQYGYDRLDAQGTSFAATGSTDYYVRREKYEVTIFFNVKTPYPKALEDDIVKRFPGAVHTTITLTDNVSQHYEITINDEKGQHLQTVSINKSSIDDEEAGGGASLTIVK